jgi:hypothetical protein
VFRNDLPGQATAAERWRMLGAAPMVDGIALIAKFRALA